MKLPLAESNKLSEQLLQDKLPSRHGPLAVYGGADTNVSTRHLQRWGLASEVLQLLFLRLSRIAWASSHGQHDICVLKLTAKQEAEIGGALEEIGHYVLIEVKHPVVG